MACEKLRKFIYRRINIYMHREMTPPLIVGYSQIRIYPTVAGFLYLICAFILFLLGINYQNNLIIILCCLLLGALPFVILDSYANMNEITVEPLDTPDHFAGETVRFRLKVSTRNRRHALKVAPMNEEGISEFYDVIQEGSELGIVFHPEKRGYLEAGAFVLTSTYPLGIICTHVVIDFHQKALIYPRPLAGNYHLSENASSSGSAVASDNWKMPGMDELSGLRPYREGEPPSLISWKQVAMNRGLYAKDFTATVDENEYLDMDTIPGNLEEKISVMTYAVLQLSASNRLFGLKLGNKIIEPSQGEEHRKNALKELALFNNF